MKSSHARPAALVAAALLVAALPAAAETIDREFHQRFDVTAGDSLELHFGDGDVEVKAWDQDALEVHVRYHVEQRNIGFSSKGRRDFSVDFDRHGDVVRVIGREPEGAFGFGVFTRREHEYRYTVSAPSYLALDLRGDDGDVRIAGWSSAVSLSSDDGDFELTNSDGDLRLRMEDGDVLVDQHRGSMDLRLDDGDVEINGCRGERVAIAVEDGDVELAGCEAAIVVTADDGDVFLDDVVSSRVDVRTSDGDLVLQIDSPGALDLQARTEDGNVDLDLGAGVSARFTIDTDDGRIRVEGAPVDLSRERHYATGVLGDGAGTIRVLTQDGGVTLRHRGAPPPAERPANR